MTSSPQLIEAVTWSTVLNHTGVTSSMFNHTDVTTPFAANATREPYVRPFDEGGIAVSAALLFTFLVLGLMGNILTIAVISTNPKLKNVFMHFIMSLCCSDLISALISWLFLYRRTWGFDLWSPLPEVFCRFYWAADLMTNFVTALHILSFAILRYISIQFPLRFAKIKLKHGKIWIVLVWLLCFGIGFIPFFIFFGARVRDRYSDSPDARWPACTINMEWYEAYTTYQKIVYPILLYAPTVGVVLMCILIGVTVRTRTRKRSDRVESQESNEKQRSKERQAVLQLTLIVVSFLIGYIPFTAYEFWSVQPHPNTMYYKRFDYWFGMSEYLFLRFSECLNPMFYNLGSAKMRKCTKRFIRDYFSCCCRKQTNDKGSGSSTPTRPTADFGV